MNYLEAEFWFGWTIRGESAQCDGLNPLKNLRELNSGHREKSEFLLLAGACFREIFLTHQYQQEKKGSVILK